MPVKVNGETIPEADIRTEMASIRAAIEAEGGELTFEQRMRLRDQAVMHLVEHAIMTQEARRLNLAGREALIKNWMLTVRAPSSGQVREYYRNHREEFRHPECLEASHIVKNHEGGNREENRTALEGIRERIVAGEDFAMLAKAHSDCPEKGGDLGLFARGVMVEEFDAVVFSAPLHGPTPIFETRFGLHIAVVHKRLPAGIWALPDVEKRITRNLHKEKLDREVGHRIDALLKSAQVEVQ